jgi:hypothetical protein
MHVERHRCLFFAGGSSHIRSGGFTIDRAAVELGVFMLKLATITPAYEIWK